MQLIQLTYNTSAARAPEDDVHQLCSASPVLVVDVTVPGSARLVVFRSGYAGPRKLREADVRPRTFAQINGSKRPICTNAHTGTYH